VLASLEYLGLKKSQIITSGVIPETVTHS
jgi:hypothetical protein